MERKNLRMKELLKKGVKTKKDAKWTIGRRWEAQEERKEKGKKNIYIWLQEKDGTFNRKLLFKWATMEPEFKNVIRI